MSNWLIAIAVTLLVGGLATVYFHLVQRRRDETRAGITALSGVSWRSFIHMVLDALGRRGFTRLIDEDNSGDDQDFVLVRDQERWLLSCKHGSAFVLGRLTVNELARAIQLKDAAGAFLVTQGRISDEVRPVAALQRIELLDGPALWPQLRDFLPAQQLAAIRAQAARLARQRILLSWLAALLAGVATWLALPAPSRPVPTPGPAAAAPAAEPAAPAPADPGEATTAPGEPAAPAPIERQRADVAAAISTLPDVNRAFWSTESTLHVILNTIDGDAFTRICPLMERYDELASSRIQLTPPPDSGRNVRFRQCRNY
jgi:restriction system protein